MSIPISQFIPPALFPHLVPIHLRRTILTVIYPGSEGPGWVSAQSRNWYMALKMKMSVAQSCPTLCDPMDCSPPGSSVHGILQARILEWVAIPFSRGSSWPRNQTWVFHIEGRFFTIWTTREALVVHYLKRPLQQPLRSQLANAHGCQQEAVQGLEGCSSTLHALTHGHVATRTIKQTPRHTL